MLATRGVVPKRWAKPNVIDTRYLFRPGNFPEVMTHMRPFPNMHNAAMAAVLASLPIFSPQAAAQELRAERGGRNISVTIAAVASLPPGSRAVVQRSSGRPARNLIIVGPDATARELSAALVVLQDAVARRGDDADGFLRITIPAVDERQPLRPQALQRTRLNLDRLRDAPVQQVDGVGSVRAITPGNHC